VIDWIFVEWIQLAGSCEQNNEPTSAGATELVTAFIDKVAVFIYLFICTLFNEAFSVSQTIQRRIKG
jgi:hypothetical protein